MGSGFSKHEDEVVKASTTQTKHVVDDANRANADEESKCPMKLSDGSYRYDWGALFRKDFPHGPSGSRPISPEQAATQEIQKSEASTSSGCPVKHQEYNVYSQPLDPTNNMPKVANQLPAPGQTKPISTERVASSILKVRYESCENMLHFFFHFYMLYTSLTDVFYYASPLSGRGKRRNDMDVSVSTNVLQCLGTQRKVK